MTITPQHIKTKLAQLAIFSEKYTLQELANELQKLEVEAMKEYEKHEPPTLDLNYESVQMYNIRTPVHEFRVMSTYSGIIDLVNSGFQIIP